MTVTAFKSRAEIEAQRKEFAVLEKQVALVLGQINDAVAKVGLAARTLCEIRERAEILKRDLAKEGKGQ